MSQPSSRPLIVKFGGDALATPERIAAAGRRVAGRRAAQPVVAVASARRGVTDHLLGLVEQVREAAGANGVPPAAGGMAADRAVASGELVAASLLVVALADLGVRAAVLDAREAGLHSDGRIGGAAITGIRRRGLMDLLDRGITPVVTGFQGWHRNRITTLGRGGSDITAVALAAALDATACELVKEPGALHTADPRLVPEARPLARATHRFASEISLAGARVIHHSAADRAEQAGVRLRFTSLHADGAPSTEVGGGLDETIPGDLSEVFAVVLAPGHPGVEPGAGDTPEVATVSVVSCAPAAPAFRVAARAAAARAGAGVLRTVDRPHALEFLVRPGEGPALTRAVHAALLADLDGKPSLVASLGHA